MKQCSVKVVPYSKAEKDLINGINEIQSKSEGSKITCRLGALFGLPYNEYLVDEDLFNMIKDKFKW